MNLVIKKLEAESLTLVLFVALEIVVVFLLHVSSQVGRLGELVAADGTLQTRKTGSTHIQYICT
jgi:hypothetical protein